MSFWGNSRRHGACEHNKESHVMLHVVSDHSINSITTQAFTIKRIMKSLLFTLRNSVTDDSSKVYAHSIDILVKGALYTADLFKMQSFVLDRVKFIRLISGTIIITGILSISSSEASSFGIAIVVGNAQALGSNADQLHLVYVPRNGEHMMLAKVYDIPVILNIIYITGMLVRI